MSNAGLPEAPKPVTGTAITKEDGLGSFGEFLTTYHVGDLLEMVGFLIGILTFLAAAKAKDAAKRALARRDELELAALWGDVAVRIQDVRAVLRQDDWAELSDRVDMAVQVVNRVASSQLWPEEAVLADRTRAALRAAQKATSGIKISSKHIKLRQAHDQTLIDLSDEVGSAQLKRVKNDHAP